MQYTAKTALLTMSILGIAMIFVVGQVVPALAQSVPTSSNLVKRDFSVMDDQHTTASYGSSKVCGDHMCAPGEWTTLKSSINQAQISHPAVNSTKTVSVSSSITTTASTNSTVPVPTNATKPVTPVPQPVPTPPSAPSSICVAVKAALGNSTVSAGIVTKIMSDLGCSS